MDDRRIAKIVFGRHVLFSGFPASEMIALLKELPENTNIIGFGEEIHKACVCIGVEHPSFKKVSVTECMPEIEATFVKTQYGTKVTIDLSSVLEKPDYTGSVKSNWQEIAKKVVVPEETDDWQNNRFNLIYNKQDLEPRKSYQLSPTAFADAAKLYSGKDVIQETINKVTNEILRQLASMSSYDDDNEYPLWFTDETFKAQQEALDNLHKQLANTPTTPANQIYDPAELTRALDEGYNWAISNHPDNFKAEHEHKWERYNGAFRSFDYCSIDNCKMNRDDDGRIWKS